MDFPVTCDSLILEGGYLKSMEGTCKTPIRFPRLLSISEGFARHLIMVLLQAKESVDWWV